MIPVCMMVLALVENRGGTLEEADEVYRIIANQDVPWMPSEAAEQIDAALALTRDPEALAAFRVKVRAEREEQVRLAVGRKR